VTNSNYLLQFRG